MSDTNHKTGKQSLAKRGSSDLVDVKGVVERLPTWALVPSMIVVFALLMADLAVTDPIPFVDEALLLWALVSGMRTLGSRRKAARTAPEESVGLEKEVVADVEAVPVVAPGQPLPPLAKAGSFT